MEIVATNALISINATFVVQLVSFLIFLFVINRIMFRPLRSTMQQRSEYIDDVQTQIDQGRQDLADLVKHIDAQRAEAIREADAATSALESEGDRQASDRIEQARQHIAALRTESEARVANQVNRARQALAAEVEPVTVAVMEKMLQRRLES